jgi:ABC-type polysaccharide/polyol phosphate export permease
MWGLRYFWVYLVCMDVRSRYRGSVLGMAWSLVQPIAMTVILTVVFSTLFNAGSDFAPYLMSGLVCWSLLQGCALGGANCFFQAESYIRQVPAPMAIYPLRTVLGAAFHFCIALLMVFVLATCVVGPPSVLAILSLVPTLVLLIAFGWSLATLFGLANVRFRDTGHIAEVGLQALYFLTPIMYPEQLIVEKGLGWLIRLNPVVPFINLIRVPVLQGEPPTMMAYAVASLVASGFLASASLLLYAEERQLIFHL